MIRKATAEDAGELAGLAIQMWTDHLLQKRSVALFTRMDSISFFNEKESGMILNQGEGYDDLRKIKRTSG